MQILYVYLGTTPKNITKKAWKNMDKEVLKEVKRWR
jgi:hypothetical protein